MGKVKFIILTLQDWVINFCAFNRQPANKIFIFLLEIFVPL